MVRGWSGAGRGDSRCAQPDLRSSREIRTEVDEEQQTDTDQADSSRQIRQVQSTESHKHRDEREGSGRCRAQNHTNTEMNERDHVDRQSNRFRQAEQQIQTGIRFRQRI
ncbi:hypothetical protein Tco_0535580 [Tanacetum coccineum]